MRKVLKNTAKTKEYLDKLPKVYGLFLWAKWGILELPWTGKYNKEGEPLVYIYYAGGHKHLLDCRQYPADNSAVCN